jgi:glycosyltransferase involved in cell wall biosynthesis
MNFVAWGSGLYSKAIPIGSIRQDFVSERWRVGGARGMIIGCTSAKLPPFQIFNSWTAKHAAEESKGVFKPRHMYVVPNGVDVETINFSAPVTSRRILAIGRLETDKRWDRLLKALAILRNDKVEFSLRLVGDGPLRNQLQFQSRRLGLEGCVQFLGLRHDIFDLLQQSSFLIHTADAEGCPNVVLEAMAAARAVVATDAGDVPRLIENGKSGFVVRRGNDDELTHRIAALITDLDLCCAMGKAGRAKAEREFSLDQLRLNTLSAYRAAGWQDGLTAGCVSDSNTRSATQDL